MKISYLEKMKADCAKNGWDPRHLEIFRMEDPPNPPKPPESDPPKPPEGDPAKFTQDDLNRIASREKKEGRAAAEKELLEKLGVTTLEEAQQIFQRRKEAEDALKTQTQKDAEQAAADKAAAEKAKAEAATDRVRAKVERQLAKAGLEDEEIDAVADMVKVPVDADSDAIKAAIDDLKKKLPKLFPEVTTEDDPTKPKPPVTRTGPVGSTPPKPPPTPPPGNSADRAKALLASRHPSKVKTT